MALKMLRILICLLCLYLSPLFSAAEIAEVERSEVERNVPATAGMVLVKGGPFDMGSQEIFSDEEPIHFVTVKNFYIGKYEVTQKEWQAVMGNNPSIFKGDQLPVENVTWYDAVEYCNKKSQSAGLTLCYHGSGDNISCDFNASGYRLATEAEWEYACRGGLPGLPANDDYLFSGSNDAGEVAWYEENSGEKTQPVGQKKPNKTGIYDMSGNVSEWCWDRYDKEYYNNSPGDNPPGALSGPVRSYRGGSGVAPRESCRCSARFSSSPTYKYFDLGFRVVRNPSITFKDENMVFIKGGAYKMGNNTGIKGEKIVHRVTLNNFYIGKYEVTQEEWKNIMNINPALRKGRFTPVNCVDWYEAVEYCNKRSLLEGLTPCYSGSGDDIACDFKANGYRLPTEAEWEFACRGGSESHHYKFSGSNEPGEVAWYRDNIYVYYQPVGQKKPNELGIYDMSGNIGEWCWDWYDFYYYRLSREVNPQGPFTGIRRVVRGGNFVSPGSELWSTSRSCQTPNRKALIFGFRVVRTAL